ncbi:MAG: PAS domain S-box protein [Candidatus Bathyarchaeaceae archaeon]
MPEEELEKYRLIFENSPDGIIILDPMGNITAVNDVVLSYGYKREDLIGKNYLEFVPFVPEKHKPVLDKHIASVTGGKITQGEIEFNTPKGKLTMWFRASPMEKRGEIAGFQIILIDITKRKIVETRLRESEERLKQLIEYAPDAIYINDLNGNFIDGNKQAENLTGYKKEELIGRNMLEVGLLPEKYLSKAIEALEKNIRGQKFGPAEFELKRKDGTTITVEISSFPVESAGKVEVIGIARDITERKQIEERLRESEERLRDLYESVPDALSVYVGKEGHLIDYNKAFKKAYGYTDEELKNKTFLDFVHPDYHAMLMEEYRKEHPEKELPFRREIVCVNKKGENIPTEISVGPYRKRGRIIGINVMHRDITERKKMERKLQEYAGHLEEMVEERTKELKESQEQLIKAERLAAIGQLATMIGHDLRNPLTSIQNACYYLKMKMEASMDEKVKKMFEVVENEINHANKIVKDLLDFSRVKKPDLKKVDLISAIQDALTQLKFPENIILTTKFSEAPIIEADPDQLRRILQNIALNGIQAMPNGGELTVSTRKNGDFVEVAFTDTGAGIPEENMSKLFTPLFTTKAQGVGLGLAICKNIVEAHNGRIEVKSKVGKGSIFTVKLPVHQSKGGEKQP